MNLMLFQPIQVPEEMKTIRDVFVRGSSASSILILVACFLALFILVAWLRRRQDREESGAAINDPQGLFRGLLVRLDITQEQRSFLAYIASDARLKHPSVILLCSQLFDRHVAEFERRHEGKSRPSDAAARRTLAGEVRRSLFAKVS